LIQSVPQSASDKTPTIIGAVVGSLILFLIVIAGAFLWRTMYGASCVPVAEEGGIVWPAVLASGSAGAGSVAPLAAGALIGDEVAWPEELFLGVDLSLAEPTADNVIRRPPPPKELDLTAWPDDLF
jgi:hypothetical protein